MNEQVLCLHCGRSDFKNERGLAIHVRRSKDCGGPPKPTNPSTNNASVSSNLNSLNSFFDRPLLFIVENVFAVPINFPSMVKHIQTILMMCYNFMINYVYLPLQINRLYNGCLFVWTLCTDPDSITTPFLPISIQPYWNKMYQSLNQHTDMARFSRQAFAFWKFLVTPIKIDTEIFYARIIAQPTIPQWLKLFLNRLGRFIETLIGSYVFSKILFWVIYFLFVCVCAIFAGVPTELCH